MRESADHTAAPFGSSSGAAGGSAAPSGGPQRLFSNAQLRQLLFPLVIENLLNNTVGILDTIMISSLGEESIAGVALVDMLAQFIICVFWSLGTGGAVVVSQYIGARDKTNANRSACQLMTVLLGLTLFLALMSELFSAHILRLLFGSIEDNVMAASMTYFRITTLSFPFLGITFGCAALLRSMSLSKYPMLCSLMSNIINGAGNALLIYVFRWGVAGAAIATVVARGASMICIVAVLMDSQKLICLKKPLNHYRPMWKPIRHILSIGIPNGIENGLFQFGRLILVGLIAKFGTSQITANAVANSIDYFGLLLGAAFGTGMITVIGQCVGAGIEEQVRYYIRKMMGYSYFYHILWNLALAALTPLILNCYSLTPETRRLVIWLILIHNGSGAILWPIAFIFPNALRAANDVRFTMVASIASMMIFRVVGSYVLGVWLDMKVMGVWVAMVIDWICRSLCFLLRYRGNYWVPHAHFHDVNN